MEILIIATVAALPPVCFPLCQPQRNCDERRLIPLQALFMRMAILRPRVSSADGAISRFSRSTHYSIKMAHEGYREEDPQRSRLVYGNFKPRIEPMTSSNNNEYWYTHISNKNTRNLEQTMVAPSMPASSIHPAAGCHISRMTLKQIASRPYNGRALLVMMVRRQRERERSLTQTSTGSEGCCRCWPCMGI